MALNIKKEFGNSRQRKPDISTLVFGKIPPQAPELEEAILGAIMNQRDAIETSMTVLTTGDMFYNPANQKIYAAMMRLYTKGSVIDLLTVQDELRKTDELEVVGGAYYLSTLTANVVNGAHVEHHAKIVYQMHVKRETIRICGEAISEAYEDTTDPFDTSGLASTQLAALGDVAAGDYPVSIEQIAVDEIMDMEQKRESGINTGGVTSGFPTLDKLTGGWQKTDLIILAARPAVGKTAFVINLSLNAGNSVGETSHVAFFSLEMSKSQIGKRTLAASSGIPLEKIYRNVLGLTDDDISILSQTTNILSKCRLYINDRPGITPMYVKRVAKDLKKKKGLSMIVIDYLQIMRPSVKEGSREREVASITGDLKAIAKELEVPIIALCQLNREANGEPDLPNLRESGAIEQDADVVSFLYAPDANEPEQIVFKIGKHRNGACDKVPFRFDKAHQKFYDINAPMEYFNPRAGIASRDFTNNSKPYKD